MNNPPGEPHQPGVLNDRTRLYDLLDRNTLGSPRTRGNEAEEGYTHGYGSQRGGNEQDTFHARRYCNWKPGVLCWIKKSFSKRTREGSTLWGEGRGPWINCWQPSAHG
jgi:hypothetical protein